MLCIIYILVAASGGAFAYLYFSHGSDGLLHSVIVPASAAPGFERHAGFCDVNGGKCQEKYMGFGESVEKCEQRGPLRWGAGALLGDPHSLPLRALHFRSCPFAPWVCSPHFLGTRGV